MVDKRIFTIGLVGIMIGVLGCRGLDVRDSSKPRFFESPSNDSAGDQEVKTTPGDDVRYQSPVADQSTSKQTMSYPIDFPTVHRLAGADNWNVKIARQRVNEASAEYCAAKSEWMPSITLGLSYNQHEGEIQATEGNVLTVSRNSLFFGGGAGVQNGPLNGGSGGPPRLFVDFSLAEAIFKPLAARRLLGAEQARRNRIFNDTMLQASLAYYDLVRAQSQLSIAQTNLAEAEEVARLTEAFVEGGKGTPADTSRIAVIVNNQRQQITTAEAELKIASARLATILQLDPTKLDPEKGLVALEADPMPLNLIDLGLDLNFTILQAQNLRCEIAEANAKTHSARSEMLAEQWRPWLPNLYVGYSGGVFGGGQGSNLPKLDGRSDFDLVVNWQVKNLGVGTRAKQDASRSRMYQRSLEMKQIRDQIAEQVTTTYQRVKQFRNMTGILSQNIEQAGSGLEKNLAAIKGLEGIPLEALSSLEQLAQARSDFLAAMINYNQWQIRLLRAAGQSLAPDAELGCIANCNSNGCDVSLPDCPSCIDRPQRCRNCANVKPVRMLASRILSHARGGDSCDMCGSNHGCDVCGSNQGCDSCGSNSQSIINNGIGLGSNFFQASSCDYVQCRPSTGLVDSTYLDREQQPSKLLLGRPPRTAWYETDALTETTVR